VVIVAIVVFIVINWWVIIPMFGDWGRYENKLDYTRGQIQKFKAEIQREGEYKRKLGELRKQGQEVASEEAALRLQQDIISQANLTGLGYGTITPNRAGTTTTKTNFFDEASVNVSINTREKELIDFLVRLADRDLLIRAKSMDIGPDPSQTRLQGNLTLVKSFQRKPSTSTRSAAQPGNKPPASAALPTPSPAPQTPPKVDPRTTAPPATSGTLPRATLPGTNATTIPSRSLPKQMK